MQPPPTLRTCKPISILTLHFARSVYSSAMCFFLPCTAINALIASKDPGAVPCSCQNKKQPAWKGRDVIWDEMKLTKNFQSLRTENSSSFAAPPELNLTPSIHPSCQRTLARCFAHAKKKGVKGRNESQIWDDTRLTRELQKLPS